jgi:hypothetical protein
MARENRVRHESHNDETAKSRDTKSQGIVRDQRGQEQPADKERTQRTNQNRQGRTGTASRDTRAEGD